MFSHMLTMLYYKFIMGPYVAAFGAGSSVRDFFGTLWLLTGVVFVEGGGGRLAAEISASDA